MQFVSRILETPLGRAGYGVALLCGLQALSACGQKGALYLPTDTAASQRATLPQVLTPQWPGRTTGSTENNAVQPRQPEPSGGQPGGRP